MMAGCTVANYGDKFNLLGKNERMCYFHYMKLFLSCLKILGSYSKMREPNEDT